MRAALYLRISKDQDGTALGVARQEKDCRRLAAERGWEVVETFTDNDRSAFNGHRPEWERMLEDFSAGRFDVVVAWSQDRLARRSEDLLALMLHGPFATVAEGYVDPSNESDEMRAGMMGLLAQFEVKRKSRRHKRKHQELLEAGRWPGGSPPLGYTLDGSSLQVVPEEAERLREAAAAILDGASLATVATNLGVGNTRTVKRLLTSPTIAGLRVSRDGEEVKAAWAPILPARTWRRVKAILEDPERGPVGPRPRFALTGMLECGSCGSMLKGGRDRGRRIYRCIHSDGTRGTSIDAETVERYVTEAAAGRVMMRTRIMDPQEAREIHDRLDQLDKRLEAWAVKAAATDMSVAEIRAGRQPLVEERQELERQLDTEAVEWVTLEDGRHAVDMDATIAKRRKARRIPEREPETREMLERKVSRIVLAPAGRSNRVPIEERVSIEWRDRQEPEAEGDEFAELS